MFVFWFDWCVCVCVYVRRFICNAVRSTTILASTRWMNWAPNTKNAARRCTSRISTFRLRRWFEKWIVTHHLFCCVKSNSCFGSNCCRSGGTFHISHWWRRWQRRRGFGSSIGIECYGEIFLFFFRVFLFYWELFSFFYYAFLIFGFFFFV